VQVNTAILIRIVVTFPGDAEEILKVTVSSLAWKQQIYILFGHVFVKGHGNTSQPDSARKLDLRPELSIYWV
jgi:hypothetical protein